MPNATLTQEGVWFRTASGGCFWGSIRRLGRFSVVFDVFSESCEVRISEILQNVTITIRGREVYKGRAVVRALLQGGPTWTCEAELSESAWQDHVYESPAILNGALEEAFCEFMEHWAEAYQIIPAYKSVIADMHTFFSGLRLWLDQVELVQKMYGDPSAHGHGVPVARAVAGRVIPCINELFARFEKCCAEIPEDLLPAHRSYMRRQLHPLTLCAPFAHRTFHKPLGYAGDYEMVNMIVRNGWEGPSLYAQVVNKWFLEQPPAEAHRNRIAYLTDSLIQEAVRVVNRRRRPRVLNLACGPAHEIQRFLSSSPLSNEAQITLLDFDRETIDHAAQALQRLARQYHRTTAFTFVQESVFQLLKDRESGRAGQPTETYDVVYCAGLFDYLADAVCRRLLGYMFRHLEPGGLLIATNVHPSNPLRNGMEHLLDWHLIHRSAADMEALAAELRECGEVRVLADPTGVNVFLQVRKPEE